MNIFMQIGTVIRDYKILSKLGSGGMGEVWLAEHIMLGKKYAIKKLKTALVNEQDTDSGFIQRFIREARVLAELTHQNIVTLYNFFREKDDYYIILEYVSGEPLSKYLQWKGRLTEDEALNIFRQLLDGVGYAHQRGIVHRDLKPANIMYDENRNQVKILDFGIAKILGDTRLTTTGRSMGTFVYMSPEQIQALPDIDQRTDIYNLGLLLYVMLAGELPYNINTESEYLIADAIVKNEYPDVRQKNNKVSTNIAELIKSATSKNPTDRPVTCFKVSEMLAGGNIIPKSTDISIIKKAIGYFETGYAKAKSNDLKGAVEAYSKAIEVDPNYADAYYNRGHAKQDLGDVKGAINDYNRAIELDPKDAVAYNNRGIAKKALGDYSGAINDYTQAIELNPKYASAYFNRGIAKQVLGDVKGSIKDYDCAIELNPKYADAYFNRGALKQDLGDVKGAINDYDRVIELDPKLSLAYNNRGNAKQDLGDVKGSIKDYDRAIELNPKYAAAYNNRGNSKQDLGDIIGGIEDYDRAIELNPKYVDAYINRGLAKQELGDFRDAICDYDCAIELDPEDADANYNRGIAKQALGDIAGAKKDWQKAKELGDPDADALIKQYSK